MDDTTAKLVTAALDFIKALIWPGLLLWFLYYFRESIAEFISKMRLKSVKIGGNEFAFQDPAPSADKIPAVRAAAEFQLGPDGFLTVDSLRTIVSHSDQLQDTESVTAELLIFQTPKQRTWLVATQRQIFVLLDDEANRQDKRIIQTHFSKDKAFPLEFDVEDSVGIVNFAAEDTYWYYSPQLFPTRNKLEAAVRRLVAASI